MTRPELSNLVKYCPNESCGDPIQGPSRTTQYSKRQLLFEGFLHSVYAKYVCPACDYTRMYRVSLWGGDYIAKSPQAANREAIIVVAVMIGVILLTWGGHAAWTRARDKELRAAVEAALFETKEFIVVKAERAEVHEEEQVRVRMAAKIRDDAKTASATFVPRPGYFLDQEGTRFDAKVQLPAGATVLGDLTFVDIVAGQTYRYYLVAPVPREPVSDMHPAQGIKKLTVYIDESAPQEVRVMRRGE
jgi:hypothetical protein